MQWLTSTGEVPTQEKTLLGEQPDYDRAITDYSEAIRLDPKLTNAYSLRALLYLLIKHDYDRAVTDLGDVIRLNPSATSYYNRGSAYSRKDDLKRAIKDYTEAIRLDPKFAAAYKNRATAYMNKGIKEGDTSKYYDLGTADFDRAKELPDRP